MAAYHHEEGFLVSGTDEAINKTEVLFARLRVLEMFVKDNQLLYDQWLENGLEKARASSTANQP
jgi:hypothetical protein